MSHNEFDIFKDLFEPIKQFFIESNILTSVVKGNVLKVKKKYYFPPKSIREQGNQNELLKVDSQLKKNRS